MRWISAFAVSATLAGAFFAQVPASRAETDNGPWCAVVDIGGDDLSRICHFRTVEECVPFVLAGNRGVCEPNFRYEPPKRRVKPHSRHRVKGY